MTVSIFLECHMASAPEALRLLEEATLDPLALLACRYSSSHVPPEGEAATSFSRFGGASWVFSAHPAGARHVVWAITQRGHSGYMHDYQVGNGSDARKGLQRSSLFEEACP